MELFAPLYYNQFNCITNRCRHSCCIGWEIDIDEASLTKYFHVAGEIGDKLKNSIAFDGTPHFITDANGQCPFLQNDGLCELIIGLGEESLCQICSDHPRFRNFLPNRTEIGLGLCCEEAARIILGCKDTVRIEHITSEDTINSAEEDTFFQLRALIFEILQDRKNSFVERLNELNNQFEYGTITPIYKVAISKLKNIEILDGAWLEILNNVKLELNIAEGPQLAYEQLMCYLTYRHLPLCFDGYGVTQVIRFIILCFMLCVNAYMQTNDIVESARLFSSEIEYSQENIDILLDICK